MKNKLEVTTFLRTCRVSVYFRCQTTVLQRLSSEHFMPLSTFAALNGTPMAPTTHRLIIVQSRTPSMKQKYNPRLGSCLGEVAFYTKSLQRFPGFVTSCKSQPDFFISLVFIL